MNALYFAALWVAAPLALLLPRPATWARPRVGAIVVYVSIVVTAVAYWAQQLVAAATWSALPHSAAAAQLPVHVLDAFSAGRSVWLALCAIETLCLVAFARYFHNTRFERLAALGGAAVLSALAMTASTIGSSDLYAYVGHALLGRLAYAPPNIPFSKDMAPLDQWGVPMMRATYGPLWVYGTAWILAPIPSLAGKILALKTIGLVAVIFCAEVVARASGRPVVRYLVLLNPYLYWVFVANAHNDLIGVDLALLSVLMLPRSRIAAALTAIAAGCIKLPLLLVSCIPATPAAGNVPAMKRLVTGIVAIVVTLALSWLTIGKPYFEALTWYARYSTEILLRMSQGGQTLLVLRAATAAAALVVIARSWLGKRSPDVALWSVPCIGSGPFQQYQVWSMPVFLQNGAVAGYLAALPTVMACSTFTFFPVSPAEDVASVVILIAVFLFARQFGAEAESSSPAPSARS